MDQHKKRCEELRKIRIGLGNKLGLSDKIRQTPCDYQGPCKGTCPACSAEEKLLNKALLSKSAVIAGAALAITGCGTDTSLSGDVQNDIAGGLIVEDDINVDASIDSKDNACEDPIDTDTEYVLEGDVEYIAPPEDTEDTEDIEDIEENLPLTGAIDIRRFFGEPFDTIIEALLKL